MSAGGRLHFVVFYLVLNIGRGFAGLLIPLYFVSVGVPVLGVGVAVGVFGVGLLIFEVLWGFVFDRIGPRWLILITVVATTGAYLLVPSVRSAGGAIATEFVLGATAPIVPVVARSEIVTQGERASWAGSFGVLGSAYSFAQLVGSLIGSVSAPSVGLADSFYLAAGICAASYAYLLWHREGLSTGPTYSAVEDAAEAPGRPRLDWRGFPLMCLVAVPTFVIFSFFVNIIQLVVTETPAISATAFEAGIVVSSFWLSTAIFQPIIAGRGAKRARRWIGLAMLGSFGVFALMTQLFNVWEIAAGAFLVGICYSTTSPLSLSLLMVGIPRRYAGRAVGIYGAFEDVGVILGPLVGSAVWVGVGLAPAYLVLGSTFLIVLVPYTVALRSLARGPNR